MSLSEHEMMAALAEYAVPEDQLDAKARKARRILAAATDLFVQLGYRKTSIDDIARKSGVGKGTVYLYFSTKAELLVRCILLEKAAPSSDAQSYLATLSTLQEQVHEGVRLSFDLIHDMPLTARLTRGDHEFELVLDEMGADFRAMVRAAQVERYRTMFATVCSDPARVDAVARVLLSLMRSSASIILELDDLGLTRATHSRVMADILAPGVLAALGARES